MFLFIENLAGLHIATHSPELAHRRLIKFVPPAVLAFAEPGFRQRGWVITVPQAVVRVLKPLVSLTQLPVIQQDPYCWAFRISGWKRVLSDGLLTEFIVRELKLPVRRFYSVASVQSAGARVVPGCAIVGSNWLEFGSMSAQSYRRHLQQLRQRYPDATYFCHPRESSGMPEEVFGKAGVRRPDRPLEAVLRAEGIPQRLVGVCSSSLLALAAGNADQVRVDVVCPPAQQFDGRMGDAVCHLKRPTAGRVDVRVDDLQRLLLRELAELQVPAQLVRLGDVALQERD